MTKALKSHIVISSNLLSIAVNGAHVKMADLRRWARARGDENVIGIRAFKAKKAYFHVTSELFL